METALLILVIGAVNALCFFIGAKTGQKVQKGEPIEIPAVNPLDIFREREERKEAQYEADRMATIMENIEKYDGTSNGQKDVPRR